MYRAPTELRLMVEQAAISESLVGMPSVLASLHGNIKTAAELTSRGRRQIAEGNFALPGRRYPIHDITHARNALARVAQHGSPAEERMVRDAVHAKYPSINKEAQANCGRDYRREYLRDHASPEAKRHRAMRNYWNRKIETRPGQEIDHKVPLSKGGGNGRDNIRVVSREANRQKATKTAALAAIRARIRRTPTM